MATSWATVTRSNDGLATMRVVPAANDSAELKGATGLGPDVVSLVVCSGIPSYRPIGVIQNYIIKY
jgi:hypothetical protein